MERNIYGYKCKRCGHVQYPYRTICRQCHDNDHNEFDIVPLAKQGKLLTFTHLYNPPADFELVFLSLGIVELEDGNRILGQISIKRPAIGMKVVGKVEQVRQDGYTTNYGMVFYEA
ncbi:MAG TPA: zinc ribbon domain-containing protein [Candidatus Edwardsbacteria bacterium]|nr:zinc ribbon domain-containing protein [Candidatus Edwardsbacteria bacterium]